MVRKYYFRLVSLDASFTEEDYRLFVGSKIDGVTETCPKMEMHFSFPLLSLLVGRYLGRRYSILRSRRMCLLAHHLLFRRTGDSIVCVEVERSCVRSLKVATTKKRGNR